MIILTIRTDKPDSEIGLYDEETNLTYEVWPAHRQLAETIHNKIESLLKKQQITWHNLGGIVCFQGPGSFTGLRIGLTVGNTLSYSYALPIVATQGENWIQQGVAKLSHGENKNPVLPFYGADAHITPQKK